MMYIAICIAIITSAVPVEKQDFLCTYMQVTSIYCEVMDARECKYMFAKRNEFAADVETIRQRWRELYDAPRLNECYLFPERAIANELIQLNRMQKGHCEQVRDLYPGDMRIVARIDDLDARYRVWDNVRDARCEFYYVHVRRQALKQLLLVLGEEAFSRGELPFVVPQ